jgi:Fur family peroxide stress response transcriptional regulator
MVENKEILIKNGISPSFQRLQIYSYLRKNNIHPTAFKIYNDLKEQIPTLSKTTVYNVLKLLASKNLIREVKIEDNELRFDAVLQEHGHFKCSECGMVKDVFYDKAFIEFVEQRNKITDIQFNIIGVCEECLNNKN